MGETALVKHWRATQGSTSLSLRERVSALALRAESNILLLDTSGSMSDEINSGETKIDALWCIVQQLRAEGIPCRVCEFNSVPQWSEGITKPYPQGGTALAEALDFISQVRPQQVTLVTDGYPNDPQAALDAASRLGCKINVLYIGPGADLHAQDFCHELAHQAGGSYAANELKTEALQLAAASRISGLLSVGADSKPGVINL